MWSRIAHFTLKNRILLLVLLGILTVAMYFVSGRVEMSYDYLKVLPRDDKDFIYLQEFKKTYGEDGNMVVAVCDDKSLYDLKTFNRYVQFISELEAAQGVKSVLALPRLKMLLKDTAEKKLQMLDIFPATPISEQSDLDSLIRLAFNQKIYDRQVFNTETGAWVAAINIDPSYLNNKNRQTVVYEIIGAIERFEADTKIDVRTAGIPYVRAVMAKEVSAELKIFLILSALVSALVLFVFFRSAVAVLVPMGLIIIIVTCVFGTLALLDYKITILTGLIPSLIVITGVPNFVYLFTKYHQEYVKTGNKIKAIKNIFKSMGVVTLMVNLTTAIGFLVLVTGNVSLLSEFGWVAGINIILAFVVTMIFIPCVLSFLPPPSPKDLRHLDFLHLNNVLNLLDTIAMKYRKWVYVSSAVIIVLAGIGMMKVKTISFMLDDIPKGLTLKDDLAYIEKHFDGVMPLEIVVESAKPKASSNLKLLSKMEDMEAYLDSLPEVNRPISINTFVKGTTQAFQGGNPVHYRLPSNNEAIFLRRYLKSIEGEGTGIVSAFVDTTGQKLRISCKVADVGSVKLDSIVTQGIVPKINEIFGDDKNITVKTTGTTLLFIKGNNLLIDSLNSSILQAILFNAVLMAILFASFRMIIISVIPNLIPLAVTAAIMGYFGIPLKPSTSIIFSIVFGITIDNTIHFLAKYRYEIFHLKKTRVEAIRFSIKETGVSMIYTSIVLLFGFIIFTASKFGGTIALGVLTSVTLVTAMITNLTLLPALVLSFDKGKTDFSSPIEHYEELVYEEEEEVAEKPAISEETDPKNSL